MTDTTIDTDARTVVLARREAILKVRVATTLNFSEIGKVFGFADHTGVRKVILASKVVDDESYRQEDTIRICSTSLSSASPLK